MGDTIKMLSSFNTLLPQVAARPVPRSTLSHITEQCSMIKQHGKQLEDLERELLNQVMSELTRLCQDSSLDLELRLRFLEVIELRSLGWESNANLENYYREKFSELEGGRNPPGPSSCSSSDDGVRDNSVQEVVQVGSVKIFLSSTEKAITVAAKNQLEKFFSSGAWLSSGTQPSSTSTTVSRSGLEDRNINYTAPNMETSSTHQYNRETLLMLASSQESMKAPKNWARRIQALPRVIIKQI